MTPDRLEKAKHLAETMYSAEATSIIRELIAAVPVWREPDWWIREAAEELAPWLADEGVGEESEIIEHISRVIRKHWQPLPAPPKGEA